MGEPVVTELMMDWIPPLLKENESHRLMAWQLGVSLKLSGSGNTKSRLIVSINLMLHLRRISKVLSFSSICGKRRTRR